ncbi:MAG: hypothetical protein FWD96_07090, partial [Defluviitaleaceae bacterium]|nr:hypothetical protein [Defluviitaleaceae bacterium]
QDRPGNVWHVGDGLYFVEMEGIAHLVVAQRQAEVYLQGLDMAESEHRALLKTYGRKLLQKHKLLTRKAVGVMFCESVLDLVKIHPCVFINTVGTEYYEMACGSGSLAVAMVSTTMRGGSGGLPVLQPSGKVITAVVEYRAGVVSGAAISGGMCAEAEVLEIEVL